MASNGGTLHGVPQPIHQPSPGGFTCSQCGLLFDSGASLQVHMHYHHEQQQQNQAAPRWQSPSSTNSGNNSPPSEHVGAGQEGHHTNNSNNLKHAKCVSPPASTTSTPVGSGAAGTSTMNGSNSTNTIAAADSSDNQPATPSSMDQQQQQQNGTRNYQELNYYQQAAAYEQQQQQQHYQPQYPSTGADYPGSTTSANNNLMMQPPHEYKSVAVPSSRYHPYSSGSPVNNNSTSPSMTNLNSASPRIVSSSSPNHMQQQQHLGQPTPSPSPKQCDKCGLVCATASELNEHYVTVHAASSSNGDFVSPPSSGANYSAFGSAPLAGTAIKDEPACDILDLDSQKMVYNNNDPTLLNQNHNNSEGPLPSMQSLHTIQRHHPAVMWQHHTPDVYQMQQQQHQQHHHQSQHRTEYGMMSPVMKSEYGSGTIPPPAHTHLSSSPSSGGVPSIKSEYMGLADGMKQQFDQSSTTSPSEFPTTTTPQDSNNNITSGQFRNFEPPTSSLPSSGISSGKSTAWKSNEARRPKTYNCTACNKWFTSSGHLKRHYNTTLHKNAVKASNQPDPATMPISVHHHPARDPNSKHHRNNASAQAANNLQQQQQQQQQVQQQAPSTDPQRSPDYAPQFAAAAGVGGYPSQHHQQQHHLHTQGFQQYSASLHSTAGIPPNGQAGLSVHASLPRGLLTYSTNQHMEVHPQPPQLQPQPETVQVLLQHHTISSEAQRVLLDRDQLSPTTTISTGTAITNSISSSSSSSAVGPITTHQLLSPPIIISTSTEPQQQLLLPPLPGRLGTTIITTTSPPPLSRLEAIHPPLSYHTITGSHSTASSQSMDGDVDPLATDDDVNTDGMLISNHHQHHHQELHGTTIKSEFGLLTTATSFDEYNVSSASDTYTIRVLPHGGQDALGDTAPYSPSMPHDPFKSQPLLAMSAAGYDRRMTYVQQPHSQEHIMMQLPRLAETAPEMIPSHHHSMIPSPGSPSVTSSADSVARAPQQQQQQQHQVAKPQPTNSDGSKKYQCVQCDKTFNKSCYLTQHNKTFHSGEKPFKCHRCGKRFSCDQSHEEHVAKHSGDKPFKCELCPKAFNHKTDLRRHMCLHSGRKPFHCEQCGKGFIRKDHLVKHMDVHTRKAEQLKRKMGQQQQGEKHAAKKIKLEVQYEEDDETLEEIEGEEEDSSMSMMITM